MLRAVAALPALLVALSGCFYFGHCGFSPDGVEWHDDSFAGRLLEAGGDWNVTVVHPDTVLEVSDERLAWLGASLVEIGYNDGSRVRSYLRLDEMGVVRSSGHTENVTDAFVQDVHLFLAAVTNGTDTEVDAWTDALLQNRQEAGYFIWDHEREVEVHVYGYSFRVPAGRLALDAFVAEHVERFDSRLGHVEDGRWSLQFAYDEVHGRNGTLHFMADAFGGNRFEDEAWWGESSEEDEVMEGFRAAYDSLGVGPVPGDAWATGSIC